MMMIAMVMRALINGDDGYEVKISTMVMMVTTAVALTIDNGVPAGDDDDVYFNHDGFVKKIASAIRVGGVKMNFNMCN